MVTKKTVSVASKELSKNLDTNGVTLIEKNGKPCGVLLTFGEFEQSKAESIARTLGFNTKFTVVQLTDQLLELVK